MDWKDLPQWVSAVAAVVSAGGLFLAFWQLKLMERQAVTQFEDSLARIIRTHSITGRFDGWSVTSVHAASPARASSPTRHLISLDLSRNHKQTGRSD